MAKMNLVKTKFSALDGQTMIRWTEEPTDEARAFTIEASPTGIRFKGTMQAEIEDMAELQAWAEVTSIAWQEHRVLRNAVLSNKIALVDKKGRLKQ
jgi:hypothetical protein